MMRFRVCAIWFLAMFLTLPAGAQSIRPVQHEPDTIVNPRVDGNPSMAFEKSEIKGERLSEDDAPKAYTFTFTNKGDKPLVITRINTSCGCAVAEYDNKPVQPGKQGEIIIRYNPKDHPGKFNRRIYVYTNHSENRPSARLTISGEVTPTADQWRNYPVAMGTLRLKRGFMRFAEITRSTSQTERMECANSGSSPLRLSTLAGISPIWLTFRTEPEVIAPGQIADLVVEINGRLLPPDTGERMEYNLLLDGINARPSERSLKIVVELK